MSFGRLMVTKEGYVMGIDMVPVISNVAMWSESTLMPFTIC
jgi:hypothetical protein